MSHEEEVATSLVTEWHHSGARVARIPVFADVVQALRQAKLDGLNEAAKLCRDEADILDQTSPSPCRPQRIAELDHAAKKIDEAAAKVQKQIDDLNAFGKACEEMS